MSITVKEIKEMARDSLQDNLSRPILISGMTAVMCMALYLFGELLFTALRFYFPGSLSSRSSVVIYQIARLVAGAAVLMPYISGAVCWYFTKYSSGNCSMRCVFACYRSWHMFIKSIALNMLSLLPAAAITAVYLLSAYGLEMLRHALSRAGTHARSDAMLFLSLSIITAGYIFMLMWMVMRFSMSNLLFSRNPDDRIMDILRRSDGYMSGRKWFLVKLCLSFLPWLPVCVLGFTVLIIVPYCFMSVIIYFDMIIESSGGDYDTSR